MKPRRFATLSVAGDSYFAQADAFPFTANAAFTLGDVGRCVMDADGNYTSVSAPTAASLGTVASAICSDGIFAVCLATVASGAVGKFLVRGPVSATCLSTANAAINLDEDYIANTSKQLEVDQATGDTNKKLIALAPVAVAGGGTSTPAARTVLFEGIEGFGRHGGTTS